MGDGQVRPLLATESCKEITSTNQITRVNFKREKNMHVVTSKDGTKIAYEKQGEGPAVILVAGALCARLSWSGPQLSKLLAPHFTVYNYDRRGRGDSGDTKPYAVAREVEDLEAVIDAAGGQACVYGISSGAVLAVDAARRLPDKITKLALYEPPCVVDDSRPPWPAD